MITNILKEKYLVSPSLYSFVYKRVNIDIFGSIFSFPNKLSNHTVSYRQFDIEVSKAQIKITLKKDSMLGYLFVELQDVLSLVEKHKFLELLADTKTLTIKNNRKTIFNYLHQDLFILINLLKSKKIENKEVANKILTYLSFEINYNKTLDELYNNLQKDFERSGFTLINKNSLYYQKSSSKEPVIQNKEWLSDKLKRSIDKIDCMNEIEIQFGFEEEKVLLLLSQLNRVISALQLKTKNENLPSFGLKIKKIKRTKKNGLFVKHLNLIVADPRHVDSLWHELAHWIEENELNYKEQKARKTVDIENTKNNIDLIYQPHKINKELAASLLEKDIVSLLKN